MIDRSEVVEAARRVVERHGADTTMEQIADEAGVGKPVVYRLVGDKAAVVTALSEVLLELLEQATTDALDPSLPPREQFRSVMQRFVAGVDDHRNLFVFVNASGHSAELFRRLVDRSADGVTQLLLATPAAAISPSAARTWAYSIVGALQVTVTMWIDAEHCAVDALAEDLTALLWDGLAAGVLTPPTADRSA